MELDKRIKSIDCIRSFNTNNDDCLGKFGYFTNYVTNFDDLNSIRKGICSFKDGSRFPFYCDDQKFQFFIPENELLPKEKKYRPYVTVSEFFEKENLETYSKIRIRNKNCQYDSQVVHIVGFGQKKIDDGYIEYLMLGCHEYSLENLFANYEFQFAYTDEFKPFGVEV